MQRAGADLSHVLPEIDIHRECRHIHHRARRDLGDRVSKEEEGETVLVMLTGHSATWQVADCASRTRVSFLHFVTCDWHFLSKQGTPAPILG